MEPSVNTNAMDIATMKAEIKTLFTNDKRHEEIMAVMQSLATSAEVTSKELVKLNEEQEKMRKDIEELKDRPRNKWESLVAVIIAAVVGGIVVFIFSSIGLRP